MDDVLIWILWQMIRYLASAFGEVDIGSLFGSFFGLLIPGLITVFGSFALYQRRQNDSKRNLRAALYTEIKQMDELHNLANGLESHSPAPPAGTIPPSKLPPSGVFPVEIYKGNVNRLGLLEKEIQEDIVEFYSEVINQKAIIDEIREGNQIPDADHKELYEKAPDLKNMREQLISQLEP